MFELMRRTIRHWPWWGQTIAWPIYFTVWLPCSIIGWVAGEIYAGIRGAAKRFIAPLLLPLAAAVILGFVYMTAPEAFGALLNLALVVGIMYFAVYVMFGGLTRTKKKKH